MNFARAGVAVMMMVAGAQGASITYNTNGAGTGFNGSGTSLNSASGVLGTLTFTGNPDGDTGVPSNLNYGNFVLTCAVCSTQAGGVGAFFDPFIFNIVLTNITTGGSGTFTGLSTGGIVFSDVSTINIDWVQNDLGSGTTNLDSGTFGSSIFSINAVSAIVAPNSGQIPGQTTVQGAVIADLDFPIDAVPEPSTYALFGTGLLGLGLIHRRRSK